VDVQAVRQVQQGGWDAEEGDFDDFDDYYDSVDAPLGGAALHSCIQGEGEPPHELLLAAVACAASGTVRRIPVQRLREDDAIESLDLGYSGISSIEAGLLSLMLPAATSVRSLRCVSLRQCPSPESSTCICVSAHCMQRPFPCQRPLTLPLPTFAVWPATGSVVSIHAAVAPTPPRASPNCVRGLRGAPWPR
jgi:hypothetical protein